MDELGIGARHVTVSTVGLAPQIRRRSPEIPRDCIGSWIGEPLLPSAVEFSNHSSSEPRGLAGLSVPWHAGVHTRSKIGGSLLCGLSLLWPRRSHRDQRYGPFCSPSFFSSFFFSFSISLSFSSSSLSPFFFFFFFFFFTREASPSSISRRFAEEGLEVGLALLEADIPPHLSPSLPISPHLSPYLGP